MRLGLYWIIILLLLVLTINGGAQVNVEKYRKPGEHTGFRGYLRITYSSRTGNVDVQDASIGSSTDFRWKSMDWFIIMEGDQRWVGSEQYSNEGLLHFRQIFRMVSWWQPETFFQIDYNKSRLLNNRELGGVGVRAALFSTDKNMVVCGTSWMYEYESLDLPAGSVHPHETSVSRWNNYLAFNINFNARVQGSWTTYYQPMFSDLNDMRVLSEADFKVLIAKPLSMVMTFRMRYDSRPPDHIKDLDTRFSTGLVFSY